jgi:hypothetical protein
MAAPLSVTRTVANTAAEHLSDHDTGLHAFHNRVGGMSGVTKTANYALTTSDYLVISNGASLTQTLPDATTVADRYFVVKNIHATLATLATAGGNIDGVATQSIAQYNALTVYSDGTNYYIV